MISRFAFTFLFCSLLGFASAQENGTPDYAHARGLALAGNHALAEQELTTLLSIYPLDLDARTLLGRVYAWQEKYDAAIAELEQVLERDPLHQDGRNALLDALLWSQRYAAAVPVAKQGLADYPLFADYQYKYARALYETGEEAAAAQSLAQLLQFNPAHEEGLSLQKQISDKSLRYTATVAAGIMLFSELYDPASYGYLQAERRNDWGKSILRLNMASRFAEQGLQGEIDLYPVLKDGLYGYLNYGYSGSVLFPEHRAGAELFGRLSAKAEGSLGLRWLSFDPANRVLLYTGSLSLYKGHMWYSIRPYLSTQERLGTGFSMTAQARRYFSNTLSYAELNASLGYSPDFRVIQAGSGLSGEEVFALQSQRIGIVLQKSLSRRWYAGFEGSLTHQEVLIAGTDYVWITNLLARASYRF